MRRIPATAAPATVMMIMMIMKEVVVVAEGRMTRMMAIVVVKMQVAKAVNPPTIVITRTIMMTKTRGKRGRARAMTIGRAARSLW